MTKTETGGAACAWCERASFIRQGRILLCEMHYRIASMRSRSKRDGKYTPSRSEIESRIPTPFVCIGCKRDMNWLRSDGASTQATLQHDRSGLVRIVCLACNTKHAQHPDDSFWDLPEGQKRCAQCERTLPFRSFSKDSSRASGLKAWCRDCSHVAHTHWRIENRDHYNRKQREGRSRRASQY